MMRLRFCVHKKAAGRTAAGLLLALFTAFYITGCSQAGSSQEKTSGTVETSSPDALGETAEETSGAGGTDNQIGGAAGKAGGADGQTSQAADGEAEKAGADAEGDSGMDFKPGMPVKAGVMAPDFTAELSDGTSLTLSELRGKPVIINFWATWCGYCVKEMPAFERLKEDFGDKIGIIAVNCGEDGDTVKDFVSGNGYTFPVALDENFEISMLYPTNSIPYTVIVDGEGKVTHVSSGAADADTMYERYKEALERV